MNDQNLVPMNQRTKKEQREITKKGGIRSGEIRRERKKMKELLEITLEQKYKKENITYQEKIIISLLNKAIKGDVKAIKLILSIIGELPLKNNSIDNNQLIDKVIIVNDLPKDDEEL